MRLSKLDDSLIGAEEFLREAAREENLSWHEFCDKYGIIDDALERQIRRKEVPLSEAS